MPATAVLDRVSERSDDGGKRQQILDGARRVFLEHGFDGASMNEIARAASVSKGTLYVYFDSKESLFAVLIRQEKRQQAEQVCRLDEELDADLRTALIEVGTRLLASLLEPLRIAQMRTVIAASAKFPPIGQAFYEAGPRYGVERMAAFLRDRADADDLAIDDFERAAEHLMELCKSHYLLRAVLGVGERPSKAAQRAHVAAGVDIFLRAYRAG